MYRICKTFEFQAAHVLSKHAGRCRYPHGHSYLVEVVLASEILDANDMVCDFHALKIAVTRVLDDIDHSIILNSADQPNCSAQSDNPRKMILADSDPSSETLAREIYHRVRQHLQTGSIASPTGIVYPLNPHATIERVRVWETRTSWAEYEPPTEANQK